MGKESILYHLTRIMGKLPLPVLSFLSDLAGLIRFRIDKRHRTVVFDNIKAAFPGRYSDLQARVFTRKNFQHTASILFEAVRSYGLTKEELLPCFEVRGRPIKDIEINTQTFVSAIESMVRRCPEQYFCVHNRWKTKPYCLLAQDETKGIH